MDELTEEYIDWMVRLVNPVTDTEFLYKNLFYKLYSIPFTYVLPMDSNRASDAENLRYTFGYRCAVNKDDIAVYLDRRPGSVLEMMVALADRCEEQIMSDPEYGDRTYVWFWNMIDSLGLSAMRDDLYFDERKVEEIIDRFLSRNYEPDGRGGLFTIPNCTRDLRDSEIWTQLCWYLDYLDQIM